MAALYLPTDAVTGASVDVDLAADYLERLVETGVAVEGYDRLAEVARWVMNYRDRARAAA